MTQNKINTNYKNRKKIQVAEDKRRYILEFCDIQKRRLTH